jgi:hypothetical protein
MGAEPRGEEKVMKRILFIGMVSIFIMLIPPNTWSEEATGKMLIRPIMVSGIVDNAMVPTNYRVINMRKGGLIEMDVYVASPPFPEVIFHLGDSGVIERATPSIRRVINYGAEGWEYAYFFKAVKRGYCTITMEVDGQPVSYQFFVADH